MSAPGKSCGRMKRLVTNLLIAALVTAVARGEPAGVHNAPDQVAQETRPSRPAMQLVEGPKYVAVNQDSNIPRQQHFMPLVQKHPPMAYQKQKPAYHKQHKQTNAPPKFMKVIPLNGHQRPPSMPNFQYYLKQAFGSPGKPPARSPPLVFSASTGKPLYANLQIVKSPKFSLPAQTINGIRAYDVKPPKSTPTTTTTTTTTTTQLPKRTKRIWPKRILEKMNGTLSKNSTSNDTHNSTLADTTANTDHTASASHRHNKYTNRTSGTTTTTSTTTTTTQAAPRVYRKVTRKPKVTSTTEIPSMNMTVNDWIPIMPSHYPQSRRAAPGDRTRRRNDYGRLWPYAPQQTPTTTPKQRKMVYLQTYGIVPLKQVAKAPKLKMMNFQKKKRHLNSNMHSGFSGSIIRRPLASAGSAKRPIVTDLQSEPSRKRAVTKVKHHHHHHHHKYVKTVEKPVPYKVEVPKPYPVEKNVPVEKIVEKIVEKKVPYAVTVEKKVPYKVEVKVPQPYPVKVVEKEYVPKPYPVIQHVQVPVVKYVEVKVPHPMPYPVQVEKKVPYPVEVRVPVDRPVPYPVHVEKKVPYPVEVRVPVDRPVPYPVHVEKKVPMPYPVKVMVPQPYPVEVKVKEPVEVIKHVPVKVYVPQPYPVEKKVPVYITKYVPMSESGKYRHQRDRRIEHGRHVEHGGPGDAISKQRSVQVITTNPVPESVAGAEVTAQSNLVTNLPDLQVTVHGNGHFSGFSERGNEVTPATKS